jgi:hypothetical protein
VPWSSELSIAHNLDLLEQSIDNIRSMLIWEAIVVHECLDFDALFDRSTLEIPSK